MTVYDKGDYVRLTGTFTNASGTYIDPSGAIQFLVKDPSGTTTTYVYGVDANVAKSSTGIYVCDISATLEGRYYWRCEATGATGQGAEETYFDVDPSRFSTTVIASTFSYNQLVSGDRDKLRLAIGDTVENSGPRPDGTNFSNEELDVWLASVSSWQAAIPIMLRILANQWASVANTIQIGEYRASYSRRAEDYLALAMEWENKMANILGVWSGTVSWRSTNDEGVSIGKMFGKKQWGADPTDWQE